MSIKTSTGFATQILGTGSAKSIMDGGFIKIYSGTPPTAADEAIGSGNILLCTITAAAGAGLTLDAAAGRSIPKAAAETWGGTNVAGGVATFYRHVAVGDTGAASTTEPRIQGTIGVSGADMNITAGTTLSNGAPQTLNFYQITLPTL